MDADKPRDVDALIDGVAREMTGGEPSAALRAEVLRQIAAAASAAAPPPTITWRPWAAAAAAVVVAAAVVWQLDWQWNGKRNDSAGVRPVPDRAAAHVPAPARPDALAAPPDAAVTVTARERASADQAAPQAVRLVARQSPAPPGEVSVEIEPLAIDPLRPAALVADTGRALADIEIDLIPIRPLAISALASDDVE